MHVGPVLPCGAVSTGVFNKSFSCVSTRAHYSTFCNLEHYVMHLIFPPFCQVFVHTRVD